MGTYSHVHIPSPASQSMRLLSYLCWHVALQAFDAAVYFLIIRPPSGSHAADVVLSAHGDGCGEDTGCVPPPEGLK